MEKNSTNEGNSISPPLMLLPLPNFPHVHVIDILEFNIGSYWCKRILVVLPKMSVCLQDSQDYFKALFYVHCLSSPQTHSISIFVMNIYDM